MPADPYTFFLKIIKSQFSDIDLINDTIFQTRVTPWHFKFSAKLESSSPFRCIGTV